jgi:two-component system response regulator
MRTIAEILVVDDSNDDAALTLDCLHSLMPDAPVLRLIDGEQALHYICGTDGYLRRPPGVPRLALLDLHLPGMDGIALLQALRARPGMQSLPMVIWTSCSNPLIVEQAMQAGASAYHVKPATLDGYRAEIGSIVRRWLPSPATSDASTAA